MKKYIFIAVFLVKTIGLTAQTSRFKDGETLNVWATSGLNMRDKPDAKATKITAISYGAKVVVQPNIGVEIPFEVEEFKGFTVKGLWLLVKYGDKEGFVFDGFLSRLPAPIPTEQDLVIETYLHQQVKKIGKRYNCLIYAESNSKGALVKNCNDTSQYCGYFQKYEMDIIFSTNSCDEIGGSDFIEIPNVTLYEGLALAKFFYGLDKTTLTINAAKSAIGLSSEINDGDFGCNYSIKKVGNKIVIRGYCSC